MTDEQEQAARDGWQSTLHDASHRYSLVLRELSQSNPWPNQPVLAQAMNTLATELWDCCFSVTEITSAFHEAVADLPRYAAGDESRP